MRTVYSRHPPSLWVKALRPGETNRCYWVRGACERTIETAADAAAMLHEAVKQRHTASHALNEASSRSHAIFSLQLHRRRRVYKLVPDAEGGGARYELQPLKGVTAALVTRANLVDLAGSEDQRDALSSGATLKEAANINKSLFTLRKVIEHLALKKHSRAVFQEETLTKLLASSLQGDAYSLMIATISPLASAARHTRNTLHYAGQASTIKLAAPKPADDGTGSLGQRNRSLQQRNKELLRQLEERGRDYSQLEQKLKELAARHEAVSSCGGGASEPAAGAAAAAEGLVEEYEALEAMHLQLSQLLTARAADGSAASAAGQAARLAGDEQAAGGLEVQQASLAEARARERFERRALLETARQAELSPPARGGTATAGGGRGGGGRVARAAGAVGGGGGREAAAAARRAQIAPRGVDREAARTGRESGGAAGAAR